MGRTIPCSALVLMTAALMVVSGLRLLGQVPQGGRAPQTEESRTKLPEAPPIGSFGSYRVAADKVDPSKLPIIGAWRINFDRSDPAMKLQGRFNLSYAHWRGLV